MSDLEMMIRWNAQNTYGSELQEEALEILEHALNMLTEFEAPSKLDMQLVKKVKE